MAANVSSITQTDEVIKTRAAVTADSKDTITSARTIVQKITEESGNVLEASNTIQHIASQTNLLAIQILRSSEDVTKEMRKSDALPRITADSMTAMASGAIHIRDAIEAVHEITQENTHNIENLAHEVRKFKV